VKRSSNELWKKSMLKFLNYQDIMEFLYEIQENGDMHGYENDRESEYYQEYKPFFDEISNGAYNLWEALHESELKDNWDDLTVALLGETQKVLGFDIVEQDYFAMINDIEENWAVEEAMKRLERLTKRDLLRLYKKVMTSLVIFFDIKAAHDCLTSIVSELNEKGMLLKNKTDDLIRLTNKLETPDWTALSEDEFNNIVDSLPDRAWVE